MTELVRNADDLPLPEPAHTQVETYSGIALNKVVETPLFTADQLHARDAQWRAIVAAEVAKEREKCAKVCEATYQEHKNGRWVTLPQFDGGEDCAAAIRKGNKS